MKTYDELTVTKQIQTHRQSMPCEVCVRVTRNNRYPNFWPGEVLIKILLTKMLSLVQFYLLYAVSTLGGNFWVNNVINNIVGFPGKKYST